MANNTDTYWEADGVSLHTFAWSIETIGGMGPPPLRGEDIIVPLAPGQQRTQKIVDSNILTLGMWLRGVDANAGEGATQVARDKYMRRYNDLVRLLWKAGKPINLRKRFYDREFVLPIAATAVAEYKGGMAPVLSGRAMGKCTVDLSLADPYFYADVLLSQPLVNGDNFIEVPGNAPTHNIRIRINGSRANTRVLNKTNGIQFTYPTAVLNTEYVDVFPKTYDARHKPAAGAEYDASTRIIHDGSPQWMQLEPGTNTIHLQSDTGIGTVTLEARGAWI
jgi:hypothetical protein